MISLKSRQNCVIHKVYNKKAKVWNISGWDRVGIEVTGSKLNPNFLMSRASTKIIYYGQEPSGFLHHSHREKIKPREGGEDVGGHCHSYS